MSEELDVIDVPARESVQIVPVTRSLSIEPQATPEQLVGRLNAIREAMNKAMKKDVHYGVIPGTQKPTLLKPGAELLAVLFQFDCQTEMERTWGPGEHLTVEAHTTVFFAPTGARLGSGEGLCSTREKKYGKRQQNRTCPVCNKPAIIKGKAEYGGGWLCFKKKDGCGAKWSDGDPAIESQPQGEIDNPDLPDTWNTVVKMARKRSLVDAILMTTGASAIFTQDVEDAPPPDGPPPDDTHNGSSTSMQPGRPAGASPRGASPPAEPVPEQEAPAATEEDVKAMMGAANGLRPEQIRNAFGAIGLEPPQDVIDSKEALRAMLACVPQPFTAELAEALGKAPR